MSLHNVCLIMSFQFYPTFWCLPGNKPNKHQETEITPRHSCGQLWSEQLSFQTTFESIHAHGLCGSRMLWVKKPTDVLDQFIYRCPIQGVSFVRGWFFERHQSVTRRRLFTPTWGPRSPRKISKSLMKLALYIFLNRFSRMGYPQKSVLNWDFPIFS